MTDDVKPYTREELDAVEEAINQLVKNESVEDAANALDGISRRLLATARALMADRATSRRRSAMKRATDFRRRRRAVSARRAIRETGLIVQE